MTTPEPLTEAERAQVELTLSVLAKNSGAYPSLAKLLALHDHLQARVDALQVERNMAVAACWRIAGSPAGAVDVSMCARAEARVKELEERDRDTAETKTEECGSEPFSGACPTCGQRYLGGRPPVDAPAPHR